MKIKTIAEELTSLPYHGRGIIIGKHPDDKKVVIAYFIMGRSENSRNRIFIQEGDGIRTEAFDPAKMTDPHLVIYNAVRVMGNKTIVTNGDQTDTIYLGMDRQLTFEQSLRAREFEDDAPSYTPRISGIVHIDGGLMNFAMNIIKSDDGNPDSVLHYTYAYHSPIKGEGRFIHTYKAEGDPLPSYEGEPKKLEIPDVGIDSFTKLVWENLNEDNKISLFTRYIDIETGKFESRIINKNK